MPQAEQTNGEGSESTRRTGIAAGTDLRGQTFSWRRATNLLPLFLLSFGSTTGAATSSNGQQATGTSNFRATSIRPVDPVPRASGITRKRVLTVIRVLVESAKYDALASTAFL
jgi:hypothetical protein